MSNIPIARIPVTPKNYYIVVLLCCIVGVAFLLAAIGVFLDTKDFLSTAQKTRGSVIENVSKKEDGKTVYMPLIRFTTTDGKVIDAIYEKGFTKDPYKVGESLELLYQPTAPDIITINRRSDLYTGMVVLAFMSVYALSLAYVVLIAKGKNVVGLKADAIAVSFLLITGIFLLFMYFFLQDTANLLGFAIGGSIFLFFGLFIYVRNIMFKEHK